MIVQPPISSVPSASNRLPVARWRWWIALFLMGALPLLISLLSLRGAAPGGSGNGSGGAILPPTVAGLLRFCAFELGVFAGLWAIFWAFSRPSRDQLFLRFRGAPSLAWGVAYSLLMRFGLGIVAMAVLLFLALLGFDLKAMIEVIKANGETMKEAFAPAFATRDPLYRFLLLTLVSFGVAGLREELWRAATFACLFHLAPARWNSRLKNGVALGVSSLLFGAGHAYQGATGIIGTTLLGLVLGAIMLRHQSIWPAIMAHGCFDAASFAMLSALGTPK